VKILVTGAAGFLGSWFLNHFVLDEGVHDLWFMDLRPHPTLPMDQADMEEWLKDFHEHVDLAFHFAAPVGGRVVIENDPMYNADAFRLDSAFFRWAVSHADAVVYPSSSAVYPVALQTGGELIRQSEVLQNIMGPSYGAPDELYGMSKLAGEYMGWKAATKYGLKVLAIRPFSGYGPGQNGDYPVTAIARRVIAGEDPLTVWGGAQVRDFVYVTDIVEATMARLQAGIRGFEVMNIASGIGTNFNRIAALLLRESGSDRPIESVKGPIGVQYRVGDSRRMNDFYQLKVPLVEGLRNLLQFEQEKDRNANVSPQTLTANAVLG